MKQIFRACVALVFSIGAGHTVQAATYQMVLETNDDRAGLTEVFGITFDTYADLLDGNISASGFSDLNIGAGYSIGGLAYDGQYQMLLETNDDRAGLTEVFGITFDTYADLLDGNISASGFSDLNIGAGYSIGGLAYDGQYQMLLETNDDRAGLTEVFGITFDTYADLLDGNISASGFSDLNIGAGYSIGGLAYDGQYQMLLETNDDRAGLTEVFGITFDTYADLLDGNISASDFSDLNIGAGYSIGGLAYDGFPVSPAPPTVPLPAGGLLLLSGLAGFAGLRRWKKPAT